jgi:hypothetical protein
MDLSGVDVVGADLSSAALTGVNLIGNSLYEVDLTGADLRQARLCHALLYQANLSRANLDGADFTGATAAATWFCDVNLSTAKGLDTMGHQARSYIDINTIERSKGKIPESFLRGCGVSDSFITFMPSLVAGDAIRYYSCFISHSTKDHDFAERLYADLQAKGVRCWLDMHDMQGGKKLHEQIDAAIRRYEKLLVVLSESSMNSEWVKTEIYNARQDEIRRQCRKMFPISLVPFEKIKAWQAFDADTGKDMGREVREYYVPDFSNWPDYDAY